MKFIWEERDIIAGRRYTREGISEEWLIGFRAEAVLARECWVSVSLNDGLVTDLMSKNLLSDELTRNEYVPVEFISYCKNEIKQLKERINE